MKRIKCAAIQQDGKIYEGWAHFRIIIDMVEVQGIKPPITGLQGFVTEDGEFVTREEAAKIAFEAGQVRRQHSKLFSEDLRYDRSGNPLK